MLEWWNVFLGVIPSTPGALFVFIILMISKKIKMMKTNKSPGVDGITPKLLKEIVNEISTPLANFF